MGPATSLPHTGQGDYNASAIAAHCKEAWGLVPRDGWMAAEFGGAAALHYVRTVAQPCFFFCTPLR
jgi:hypothetical protein